MTSGFAPEIDRYPKSIAPNSKLAQNSVQAHCLAPLAMLLVIVVCDGSRVLISFCPENRLSLCSFFEDERVSHLQSTDSGNCSDDSQSLKVFVSRFHFSAA